MAYSQQQQRTQTQGQQGGFYPQQQQQPTSQGQYQYASTGQYQHGQQSQRQSTANPYNNTAYHQSLYPSASTSASSYAAAGTENGWDWNKNATTPAASTSSPYQPQNAASSSNTSSTIPPFGSELFQNPMVTQLGMQYGQAALSQGQQYMQKNMSRFVNFKSLKYYFNVSNSYVLNKIRLLVFPFRHKSWSRLPLRPTPDPNAGPTSPVEGFRPPREDLNAPDMYIPAMSFVTYILMVAILTGVDQEFHPEILGITGSQAGTVVVAQVLLTKLGCYLLSIPTPVSWLDLTSFISYQFIPIILVMATRFTTVLEWTTWPLFIYSMLALSFFTLRTLKYLVLPDASLADASTGHAAPIEKRRRRIHFLFAVVALECFGCWFLIFGLI